VTFAETSARLLRLGRLWLLGLLLAGALVLGLAPTARAGMPTPVPTASVECLDGKSPKCPAAPGHRYQRSHDFPWESPSLFDPHSGRVNLTEKEAGVQRYLRKASVPLLLVCDGEHTAAILAHRQRLVSLRVRSFFQTRPPALVPFPSRYTPPPLSPRAPPFA